MSERKAFTNLFRVKGVHGDRSAQMAFSMVAVILLMIAGASIMVYGPSSIFSERSSQDLASREDACQDAYKMLRETAYSVAWSTLNSTSMDLPTARLSFLLAMNETMREISPYVYGQHHVSIDASHVDISILPLSEATATCGETLSPAFFTINGNVTIDVTDSSGKLTRSAVLQDEVYLPLPLLQELSSRMASATESGSCDLWACVRYELSCLMQFRVLMDPALAKDATQAELLVQEEDVRNALILSIVLQQRSILNTYDASLLDSLMAPPGGEIFVETVAPYLAMEGVVDPADLFLMLYGIEEFPIHQALAQALYSAADLLALRYLDYFHVIDIIDFIEEKVQSGLILVNDILDWAFGKDLIAEQAISWVKSKMSDIGHEEDGYRYLWTSPIDWTIELPEFTMKLKNETGGMTSVSVDGNYSLDVGTLDIFSSSFWKNSFVSYKEGSNEIADAIVRLFQDIAIALASRSSPITISLILDPFDGVTPIEALRSGLDSSLLQNDGWFTAASNTIQIPSGPDPLGQSMAFALDANSNNLFGKESVIQNALYSLTEKMYEKAVEDNPELRNAPHEDNLRQLRTYASIPGSEILAALNASYVADTGPLISQLKEGFLATSDSNFIHNCLIKFSSGLISCIPSIESWIEDRLGDMMDDVVSSSDLSGTVTNVTLPTYGPLMLGDGRSGSMQVNIVPHTSIECFVVTIIDPVRNGNEVSSIHITDLLNTTSTPFQATWKISTAGQLSTSIVVRSPSGLFPGLSRTIWSSLESDVQICTVTGWPMAGIDYHPSNTLTSDALALLKDLWNLLSKVVSEIGKAVVQILHWILQVVQEGGKVAEAAFQMALGGIDSFIEFSRNFVEDQLVDGLGKLLETLTGGHRIDLVNSEFLGVTLSISLNQGDLALARAKNIVKMTIGYRIGSDSVSVSGRIIKLSNDYRLLINGTVLRSNSRLALVVDPFMTAYSHLIEVRGWADGVYVEMNIPEVSRYSTYSFSLQDLPGLGAALKNIPTPIPPILMSINAGLTVRFASGSDPHPVINEFEPNPTGSDAGKEWVEIFNPSNTVLSLSGWSLQTNHGYTTLDVLGDVILLPYTRMVYTLPEQSLDNGDSKTFPFSDGLALIDPSGKRVDVAPIVMDQKNDGRTWQRADDGSERWEFKSSTKGSQNSRIKYADIREADFLSLATNILGDVFERCEASGWTLECLSYAVKTSFLDFQRNVLETWGESMLEVSFFVDIALTEKGQVGSIGQRFTLSIDSDILTDIWEWACSLLAKIMSDPLHGPHIIAASFTERIFLEHIWFGMETYAKLGTPDIMKEISKESGLPEASGKLSFKVKFNLASIGLFIGKDLGKSKMQIGVACSGTLKTIPPKIGCASGQQTLEAWLFKVSLSKP